MKTKRARYCCGAAAPPKDLEDCGEALLRWWDRGHRSMPWRREAPLADRFQWAYQVWVSEVMLQQTQVDRVVPYYEKWLAKWPTVDALAEASIDEVRALWTGLGYYRRAAFLVEGAKQIVAMDAPPKTRDAWLKVKGVGPYTAAAIASICFDERVPVVDGNVVRVLARLRAVEEPNEKLWWRLAGEIVNAACDRPGDANQALMELGATVCTKANPSCDACPLRDECDGADNPERYYPFKKSKTTKPKRVRLLVCVLQRAAATAADDRDLWTNGDFAILRRPEDDALLSGLWQLPSRLLETDDIDAEIDAVLEDLLPSVGGGGSNNNNNNNSDAVLRRARLTDDKPLAHSITNRRYDIHVAWLVVDAAATTSGTTSSSSLEWCDEAGLAAKGASSILAKALGKARSFALAAPPEKKRKG
ncbi:hypothetical protein CTAYLR_010565 [Chrysophaeum taylorii]|uniref:Adenine DNA glycosylase n=1 Tax=Chrysophaeum taylorii TaxID=2483200 RepID=A0AAD7XR38_9STRA|nr:hypothetical protein CTAYLR_010565 [Chrysophaeum taylorii]